MGIDLEGALESHHYQIHQLQNSVNHLDLYLGLVVQIHVLLSNQWKKSIVLINKKHNDVNYDEQKGEKIITQFFCGSSNFKYTQITCSTIQARKNQKATMTFWQVGPYVPLGNLSKCWIILNIQYTPLGSVDVVVPHACHNS